MIPLARYRKAELLWMLEHKCKHGELFVHHRDCYEAEQRDLRVGFFDIETTHLKADFGIVLCWCCKEAGAHGKLHQSLITRKDMTREAPGFEDKRVVSEFVRLLPQFDKVVGFYSSRFDAPFMRARALQLGLEFPAFATLRHRDLYFTVRNRFALSSNRLENACRAMLGKTNKTRIEPAYWRAAGRGDPSALQYVLKHCKLDVEDLERLYNRVERYARGKEPVI